MKNLHHSLNIIWTIARKDILDILKDKATRYSLLGAFAIILLSTWLSTDPFFKEVDIVVYDAGASQLTATLEGHAEYNLTAAASPEEMVQLLSRMDLGLVIPEGFDQQLEGGAQPVIDGYINWDDHFDAAELEGTYAEQFSALLGGTVLVHIGENILTPAWDARGPVHSISLTMMIAVFWMAIAIVPRLMVEEKHTRTLDALLVSPAATHELVWGKAVAGSFYIVLNMVLALVLNWAYVVNWWLMVLLLVISVLFAVGLSLLMGAYINNLQQVGIIAMPVLAAIVISAQLIYFAEGLSSAIMTVLSAIPTVALVKVFRFALSDGAAPLQVWGNIAFVVTTIALIYALLIRKVQRSDR